MNATALSALNAYQNQLKLMQQAGGGGASPEETGHTSFAQLVGDAIKEARDIQYKTEELQMQSITGKVDLSDLVTAVSNAELTLNTVVAVRDRVINAYQDIIRMAI